MLTPEQIKSIKIQLIEQIMSSFPEDRKQFAISQIESMDSVALEEFLVKNGLVKKEGAQQQSGNCVFCSIVFGDINAYKIAENSKAIAVLEINPVSHGHSIVIPKEHITSEKNLSPQVSSLARKVSSILKSRLKAKQIEIKKSNIMGHEILNVIPVYENQTTSNERQKTTPAELSDLQNVLTKKLLINKSREKKKSVKKVLKEIETKFWLPKRIP
jgi:diadenosine tetraphosphate (Ap4A) HIT family hydrolase